MIYVAVGLAIVAIATLIGLLILKLKAKDQPKQVKIILFGVYFWGLVFLQLLICAVAYELIMPQ